MDELQKNHLQAWDAVPASALATGIAARNEDPNTRHFRTDQLLANLKRRTVSSGFITVISQGCQFLLTLGSTMVLARLLSPQDFGVFAMASTIIGFLRVFKDAGLSTATIQKEGITHAQVSNLFWINIAVSAAISLSVACLSPVVAWFYRDSRLVGITLALSASFLLAGAAVQHQALFNRQMRFKVIALIQGTSALIGVLIAIAMARLKYGYWSLVAMNLATSLGLLTMTWCASDWRPQFFVKGSGARPLLHFGANLTTANFLYSLARGMDGLLIGRTYGAASVGLYTRAAALLNRPLEQFIAPIEAVFIPTFSRLQTNPERYRRAYLQVYETIAFVSFVFTGSLFALARPLTLVVLGPKWENAAVIFGVFTFAALQCPLGSCASWLFTSQGRGKESLFANCITSSVLAISFFAGLPFGPLGVAIAYSVSLLLIQIPIYYWFAGRRGPVRASDLWLGFFRQLPLWCVVCAVSRLAYTLVPNVPPAGQVIICAPAGLLAGALFVLIYPPSREIAKGLFSIASFLNLREANAN